MEKTLVIILAETREHETTFDNFKINVLDELNADLCLCIGIKNDYNFDNMYYKTAKYKKLLDEYTEDYGVYFEYVYNELTKNVSEYEEYTINYLHKDDTNNYIFTSDNNKIIIKDTENYPNKPEIQLYKKRKHWRTFLKFKSQFLGGIKDAFYEHKGSGGILIFYRYLLLDYLINADIINKYDRFVITRSDYIYTLPHPKMEILNKDYIWVPNGEYYNGITDRHAVLSKNNIVSYLNILQNMICYSNKYYRFLKNYNHSYWNLEKIILFNLKYNNINHVYIFPYIMYTIRTENGTSRWSSGIYDDNLGYYIKYPTEYKIACDIKQDFIDKNIQLNDFYKEQMIKIIF